MKYVYKVVAHHTRYFGKPDKDGYRKIIDEYNSKVINRGKYCLTYIIGKKTKPEIGKIFVYKSLKAAKKGLGHDSPILRCKYTGKLTRIKEIVLWTEPSRFKLFWLKGYSSMSVLAPDGCYGVDSITPISVVEL